MTIGKAAVGEVRAGRREYRIGFGGKNETVIEADGMMDLLERWIEFCVDKELRTNCVDYVCAVPIPVGILSTEVYGGK